MNMRRLRVASPAQALGLEDVPTYTYNYLCSRFDIRRSILRRALRAARCLARRRCSLLETYQRFLR